jgi:predicted ATPase
MEMAIMSNDRITEIHVRGMRTLADVKLSLGGLTVLIGDNGSGKSSLIEALRDPAASRQRKLRRRSSEGARRCRVASARRS